MRRRLLARSRTLRCAGAVLRGGGSPAAARPARPRPSRSPATRSTIYASAPLDAPRTPSAQDVLDAEQLAFQQPGSEVDGLQARADVPTRRQDLRQRPHRDRATRARSPTSARSCPATRPTRSAITNAQDLLQVSPTDTRARADAADARRSRTRPTALLRVLKHLRPHVRACRPERRGRGQGAGRRRCRRWASRSCTSRTTAAPTARRSRRRSGSDAGTRSRDRPPSTPSSQRRAPTRCSTAPATAPARRPVLQPAPRGESDAEAVRRPRRSTRRHSRRRSRPPRASNVYVSSPGFLPADCPPAGSFVSRVRAAYGHAPAPQAIFGYEAMTAVLDVLSEAGSAANDRTTVIHDFFADQEPVVGARHLLDQPERRHQPRAVRVQPLRAGQLVPFRFVQPRGEHAPARQR